jgi:hypothetical protein
MNFHWPFLGYSDRDVIAGLRDQVIELGTHVRFLEADRPEPQHRDPDGRFVSKRELKRRELLAATKDLTIWQRDAAKARASTRPSLGKHRGRE